MRTRNTHEDGNGTVRQQRPCEAAAGSRRPFVGFWPPQTSSPTCGCSPALRALPVAGECGPAARARQATYGTQTTNTDGCRGCCYQRAPARVTARPSPQAAASTARGRGLLWEEERTGASLSSRKLSLGLDLGARPAGGQQESRPGPNCRPDASSNGQLAPEERERRSKGKGWGEGDGEGRGEQANSWPGRPQSD